MSDMREKSANGLNLDLAKFLEDIRTVVRDGEELLKVGVSGVKERAVSGARSTEERVREHPYQSMLIVFGLGVLVGALTAGMVTREGEENF